MTEELRPDALTRVTPTGLYAALGVASRARGEALEHAPRLVLLAQWGVETGGGVWCHSWNIGNVKHVRGDGHDYAMFRCWEVEGGKKVWYEPPHPATWFRAYASLAEGVVDYLGQLQGRFRTAWPAVLDGDPVGFARALKAARYYTATEADYVRAIVAWFERFRRAIPESTPDPVAPLASASLQQAMLQHARDPEDDKGRT